MRFQIRPFAEEDRAQLYQICLQTGADGGDMTAQLRDGALLGHCYLGPYLALEAELASVVVAEDPARPLGYIVATADSAAFAQRSAEEWFPRLRQRYALPSAADQSADAQLIRQIHVGYHFDPRLAAYPAHLHIDLLPRAQGYGLGRQLITRLSGQLRERGVLGLHLGMSSSNHNAGAFYARLGFSELFSQPGVTWLGLKL